MIDNLSGITQLVEQTVTLKAKDIVLDIGCKDGTLLSSYKTEGLRHIGIDPSDVALKARAKGFTCLLYTSRCV